MQQKTRSILEELENMHIEKDRSHVIESRADNIIASAIRLMEYIESCYTPEQAENLNRKMLNAIRAKDPNKFKRSLKRTNES